MTTQNSIEILLLVSTSLTTGFVVFATGVYQKIMNGVDEATFKILLAELSKNALKSPFIIGLSLVTMLGMVPYFYYGGLSNIWFTAGLALWIITSIIAKMTRLPIYKRVGDLDSSETIQLRAERERLNRTSILNAGLSITIVLLMVIGLLF